jgi:hypothetical protein
MYSNQKDQISLEEAYNNVHNETINEDANETLGASVIYGTLLLPAIINHLMVKYPIIGKKLGNIKEYLKTKISNDEGLNTMKKNADDHGGQGASDYYKDINKKIATDIQQDQTFRSNIDNNFEQLIVQDIKNLLPKDLANKSKDQAEREVMANINRDSLNIKRRPITGFRG